MDKTHEIVKLQSILRIPITDITFTGVNVKIYSSNVYVGEVPFFEVAGIINYDTPQAILNWLNWSDLYNNNKNEIDSKITSLLSTDEIVINLSTFRKLYVYNTNRDLIGVITCAYDNEWKVFK